MVPGTGPPWEEGKGPTENPLGSAHLPFRVRHFFVEGFLSVSDPHHGGLELAGHLQGETVGCKRVSSGVHS